MAVRNRHSLWVLTLLLAGCRGDSSSMITPPVNPPPPGTQEVSVLTYHYDNAHDGLNDHETVLTPAKVNSTDFGKLGFFPVDGKVDGEPLYLPQLMLGGARHNVLYVVTEHDSVYAFDADSGKALWKRSLLPAGETTSDDRGCSQVTPEIGITDTPVIDPKAGAHGALFAMAMSKNSSGSYFQRLHALDVTTGDEMGGSPVKVVAKYPDGTPAIVEGMSGNGWVILSGVHPEAPANWRHGMTFTTPVDVDNAYAATLIDAALNRTWLPHY